MPPKKLFLNEAWFDLLPQLTTLSYTFPKQTLAPFLAPSVEIKTIS